MTLRIGVLGAARITPMALVRPAREVGGVSVTAIAARDERRAAAFARRHGIPRVHGSYQALLDDPAVDAIYNPLPNSLHAAWTLRAIERGKHVLCEKPLTSNAREAALVDDAARGSPVVVMEAFHWRYHPLAARMLEVVQSGQLGRLRHIETWMCVPLPLPGDIRYRLDLAGGAMMDTGCYAAHIFRTLAGAEPRVASAQAWLSSPGVDRAMTAELALDDGVTGRVHCSLFSSQLLRVQARVVGERGTLSVLNPVLPQFFDALTVRDARGTTRERVPGRSTYAHQLEAFRHAVQDGRPVLTPTSDAVLNMRLIDSIYAAAGLAPRAT